MKEGVGGEEGRGGGRQTVGDKRKRDGMKGGGTNASLGNFSLLMMTLIWVGMPKQWQT